MATRMRTVPLVTGDFTASPATTTTAQGRVDEEAGGREGREQEHAERQPRGTLEEARRCRPRHELLVGDAQRVEREAVAAELPTEPGALIGVGAGKPRRERLVLRERHGLLWALIPSRSAMSAAHEKAALSRKVSKSGDTARRRSVITDVSARTESWSSSVASAPSGRIDHSSWSRSSGSPARTRHARPRTRPCPRTRADGHDLDVVDAVCFAPSDARRRRCGSAPGAGCRAWSPRGRPRSCHLAAAPPRRLEGATVARPLPRRLADGSGSHPRAPGAAGRDHLPERRLRQEPRKPAERRDHEHRDPRSR